VAPEKIPDFLRGRGWVLIGSVYSTDSHQGSLDEHLKRYLKRATAGWVAVVPEKAAVIMVDRSRGQHRSDCAQAGKASEQCLKERRGRSPGSRGRLSAVVLTLWPAIDRLK
jgi:hypothetical protein